MINAKYKHLKTEPIWNDPLHHSNGDYIGEIKHAALLLDEDFKITDNGCFKIQKTKYIQLNQNN